MRQSRIAGSFRGARSANPGYRDSGRTRGRVSRNDGGEIFRQPDKRTPVLRRIPHEALRENLDLSRRALRASRRHRPDAAVDLHVLVRRRAGKIHRRDLFGRTIAVASRLRGAARADADDLAAARGVHASGAAVAAIAAGHALDARSRGVLSRHRLSAARRRHHLLSGVRRFSSPRCRRSCCASMSAGGAGPRC